MIAKIKHDTAQKQLPRTQLAVGAAHEHAGAWQYEKRKEADGQVTI
jgi:hypothetical protein